MVTPWLSFPAYLAVQLGFAGVLGAQIYHLRAEINSRQVAAAFALVGLVVLPPLSMPAFIQWLGWLAATLVVVLFAIRPHFLPDQIWTLQFALRYAAFAMLVIAIWGIIGNLSSPLIILGLCASLAAVLAWNRGTTT